ncbi:MAG TPA: tetratricopeptide repeat protein [Leeuwenhoekiella sp.]|nr:tetratricopeptide repeat protein [Leeuwenhoekiella sp.]
MRNILLIFSFLWFALPAQAQEDIALNDVNVDDLGNVTDKFQESFFEALKQKAIENYDRAITALDQCIALQPEEAILYFEKGKNMALSGDTEGAESNYLKALKLRPKQRDIMESLYEVYYAKQEFDKAIDLVKQLIDFDVQYKEDLARIYIRTKEFDKALALLDQLDEELGKDTYRDQMRRQAYALSGGDLKEQAIEERIKANPEAEQNYLNLIYVFSEQGDTQKAYETAQKLLKINPKSDAAHLALYKFNLDKGNIEEAVRSMDKVLKSTSIEVKAKHSVLNDFLLFVEEHPEFENELEEAIALFSEKEKIDVNQELASYYLKNDDKEKALSYYVNAYQNEPEDFNVIKNLMILQLEAQKFQETVKLAQEGQDLYPSQPIFYLISGVANNSLENFTAAINDLEMGIDYVIEDPTMKSDFYTQLGVAYEKSGDPTKAAEYKKRATELMQ